jgi:hypothetical protein
MVVIPAQGQRVGFRLDLSEVLKAPSWIQKGPSEVLKAPSRIQKAPSEVLKAPSRIQKAPSEILKSSLEVASPILKGPFSVSTGAFSTSELLIPTYRR